MLTATTSSLERQPANGSALGECSADGVVAALRTSLDWPNNPVRGQRAVAALYVLLEWLSTHSGSTWQERWDAAGGNDFSAWISDIENGRRGPIEFTRRNVIDALPELLVQRVIAVDYQFLRAYRAHSLYRRVRQMRRPELWDRVATNMPRFNLAPHQARDALLVLSKMTLVTGRDLDDLEMADFSDYLANNRSSNGSAPGGVHAAWDLVRGVSSIPDVELQSCLRSGQLSASQILQRFRLRSTAVHDLIVRYLEERQPSLDYTSFESTARQLGAFWADIEQHNPGITSLHLSDKAAREWKVRLRSVTTTDGTTRTRVNYLDTLMLIRAFYLDIQEWAHSDSSWALWAAPSPVHRNDTKGFEKAKRSQRARAHQRVRSRLPHLEQLVDSTYEHKQQQAELLAVARECQPGETFVHGGTTYRRTRSRPTAPDSPDTKHVHIIDQLGDRIDVVQAEDDAFWAWSIIETLRHTGVRIEELAEITHLAVTTYRPPDTGEALPMLQIVPSKSNAERLLLVSPELASVLATIITRLRCRHGGSIPLVTRYDKHERTTGPALPHLFQRSNGHRQSVIGYGAIRRLLDRAIERLDLRDAAGELLRFTPHDFRRIFATNAVTGGLPIHIAAKVLGHSSINTTQTYVAVFHDEVMRAYRTFLESRRSMRPPIEYREPTADEWREFQQHFAARTLELGTCGRPYGSPCIHEHACIRCPMLRVDPRARPRLVEIIANLRERIDEARMNGWLGEIQGLETSRAAAIRKLSEMDRSQTEGRTSAPLGIPTVRSPG